MCKFLFVDFEKCVISTCLKHSQLSDLVSLGVKPYVKFHHYKSLETIKVSGFFVFSVPIFGFELNCSFLSSLICTDR